MFKIAICDNDEFYSNKINSIVSDYMKEHQLEYDIDIYNSGDEFVRLGINMSQYNIIFLDIEMDGLNGIQTAQMLREYCSDSFIIFVTAYAEYSLQGYSVDTLRYIIKNNSMLKEAIEESLNTICKKLKYNLKLYTYDFKEGIQKINLEKIFYIESMSHNLIFHILTEQGEELYTLRGSLKDYDAEYSDRGFVRIHQSFLVNCRYIKKIKYNSILLKNDKELPVSKAKYKAVKQKYISYKGNI